MSKVVIFGCGEAAKTAFQYFKEDSPHDVVAFTVDKDLNDMDEFLKLPVCDFEEVETVYPPSEYEIFVLLGYGRMNLDRKKKYIEAKTKGYNFASYINSSVKLFGESSVGENCFILHNQAIDLDVRVKNNVVIWSGNHIGDRTVIESHSWISSGVSIGGDVVVGERCFLGLNSSISNNVVIGEGTFIGASTSVAEKTAEFSVYATPPAKEFSKNSERFSFLLDMK